MIGNMTTPPAIPNSNNDNLKVSLRANAIEINIGIIPNIYPHGCLEAVNPKYNITKPLIMATGGENRGVTK